MSQDVIGKKANLLSYVLTEEKLYIIVTNSRGTEIITRDIDSTFYSSPERFRSMLSVMPATTTVTAAIQRLHGSCLRVVQRIS